MKEFEELQQIWQEKPPRVPLDFDALMQRIRAGKQGLATKFGWHVLAFALGLMILLLIWATATFVTWTSHAALLLMCGCLLYALLMQYRSFRELRNLSVETLDRPANYIAYLRHFRERNYRQHTRSFRIYGLCVGVAVVLFSLELYFAVSLGLFIGLSLFVIVWFLISYFAFAKTYLDNEHQRIRELIEDLERIQRQMG